MARFVRPAAKQKKKRLPYLLHYPVIAGVCAAGVLCFALLYRGGGALTLLENPELADSAAGTGPAGSGAPGDASAPTPDPDLLGITLTPSPTPAPTLDGRLIPFPHGSLWGYKNTDGIEVIEPKYLRALEFTKGLYAFAAMEQSGQLRYGLITRSGAWAVMPAWSNVRPYSEGYAAVEMNEKWGYIDAAGNLVIPCVYREAGDFHDGRAAVREASLFGYIDPDGELAIKPAYTTAGDFGDNIAFVEQDGKRYCIDKVGKKITTWGSERGEKYSGGYAVIRNGDSYSYYDTERKRRFKDFEGARPFSESMAAIKKGGLWGFINNSGTILIQPHYAEAGDFHNGRAAVRDPSNNKWGYVDSSGTLRVPCLYDEAGDFSLNVAIVKANGVVGLVDLSGEFTELY